MAMDRLIAQVLVAKRFTDTQYDQAKDVIEGAVINASGDPSIVQKPKTRLQLILLSCAVCGIELCYAAETAFVSPTLMKLGIPVTYMTLVWCLSPVLGIALGPLGSVSDQCNSRLGRRRPFILLLSMGIIAGLLLVPNGRDLGILLGDARPPLCQNSTNFDKNLHKFSRVPRGGTGSEDGYIMSIDLHGKHNTNSSGQVTSAGGKWSTAVQIKESVGTNLWKDTTQSNQRDVAQVLFTKGANVHGGRVGQALNDDKAMIIDIQKEKKMQHQFEGEPQDMLRTVQFLSISHRRASKRHIQSKDSKVTSSTSSIFVSDELLTTSKLSQILPRPTRKSSKKQPSNQLNSLKTTSSQQTMLTPSDTCLVKPLKPALGILFTVIGVALLDSCCDACQSPCRTYLLDVSLPSDHAAGLTTFTVMAGLGGSVGYLLGGINWESTQFGGALGGHVKVVFLFVLVTYLFFLGLTIVSVKEIPLDKLPNQLVNGKFKFSGDPQYKQFGNENITESEEKEDVCLAVPENLPSSYGSQQLRVSSDLHSSYGSQQLRLSSSFNALAQSMCGSASQRKNEVLAESALKQPLRSISFENSYSPTNNTNVVVKYETTSPENQWNKREPISRRGKNERRLSVSEPVHLVDISITTYLKSLIYLPRSLLLLCVTNLFCWMSLLCYSLYFTDFVGQVVYGGDPNALEWTEEHRLYEDGVRMGSFGMALYSASCSVYSMIIERLVNKFGESFHYYYNYNIIVHLKLVTNE